MEVDMKEVTCLCGWQCRGTEDEVVFQVQAHGRDIHGIESTREEVLAIAVEVPFRADHPDGSLS
jgi:predicted small metal-binding protein